MSRSTSTTARLFKRYPNEATARSYLESRRWPQGACCPHCEETKRITPRKGGFYRCNACKRDFTVRTGSIFERSHVPLHKWLYAMFLFNSEQSGVTSLQLGEAISVTQKSAWFMLQRMREACGNDHARRREVEKVDETTYAKSKTKGRGKKLRASTGITSKVASARGRVPNKSKPIITYKELTA